MRIAVQARNINNGQSCIAAKRFLVHESIHDSFLERFVPAVGALRVGDPMDPATEVGPLATRAIARELDEQVRRTVASGAVVATGGTPHPLGANYYSPTVLTEVPRSSAAATEELFGPVAPVFRVSDIDDAIELANSSPYGLGASAWTRDAGEQERLATELESGSVFINGMVASDPRFPFGGVKRSGYGRELGPWGLREFVNIKTVRTFTAAEAATAE